MKASMNVHTSAHPRVFEEPLHCPVVKDVRTTLQDTTFHTYEQAEEQQVQRKKRRLSRTSLQVFS